MPRIIVTADIRPDQGEPAVLFDELVHYVHLSTGHAAAQLVERLAWAIIEAEPSEGERPRQPAPAHERIPAHAAAIRARRAQPLAAY
jgi:hypothetical protein